MIALPDLVEDILKGVLGVIKWLAWHLLFEIILFNVGRVFLLVVTGLKYSRGVYVELHQSSISMVGLGVIFAIWACIAVYNNLNQVA